MDRASRMVYAKRTHPHTVHELDCAALARMIDASGPARGRTHQVTLDNYDKVRAADVPMAYPRCRICVPGVF
jgi:hypothetical protein